MKNIVFINVMILLATSLGQKFKTVKRLNMLFKI